jgi:hypothetical protein
MTDRLAKFGWMVEVTVLHGLNDVQVQYYLVARETQAEVVTTIRSSIPGLQPEDDVVVRRRLSPTEIEANKLQVDEIRPFVP